MSISSYQRAFNAGEVSPAMFGRIDDGKYQTGLAKARNVLIEPQGPIVKRPGFAYVNETKEVDSGVVLIPFNFNSEQNLVIEMGDRYFRFHVNGATLVQEDGVTPYEVVSPYLGDEVADVHFVQSADVMTLVHPAHPPMELRRYGATDWRIERINFISKLDAPDSVSCHFSYGEKAQDPHVYAREYAVTALYADGTGESERSKSVSVQCNPYCSGANIRVSWAAVAGADLYRVYRKAGGVWAFIGQTEETSITDDNIAADGSITPPIYEDPFRDPAGIESATILKAGVHYRTGPLVDSPMRATRQGVWSDYAEDVIWPFAVSFYEYQHMDKKIVDLSEMGSGGEVELDIQLVEFGEFMTMLEDGQFSHMSQEEVIDLAIDAYMGGVYIFKSAKLTAYGQHYEKPQLKLSVNWDEGPIVFQKEDRGQVRRWKFPVQVKQDEIVVLVKDSTGTGCELEIVKDGTLDGAIEAINVVAPGKGYTNPEIVFQHSWGSEGLEENAGRGGKAEASLGIVAVEVLNSGQGYDGGSLSAIDASKVTYDNKQWTLPIFLAAFDPSAGVTVSYFSESKGGTFTPTDPPTFSYQLAPGTQNGVSGYFLNGVTIEGGGSSLPADTHLKFMVYVQAVATGNMEYKYIEFAGETIAGDLRLEIRDAFGGSGAELKAHLGVRGRIESVEVIKAGEGYRAPQIYFISSSGAGAEASSSLGIVKVTVTEKGQKYVGGPIDHIETQGWERDAFTQQEYPVGLPFTVRRRGSKIRWGILEDQVGSLGYGEGAKVELDITYGDDYYTVNAFKITNKGGKYMTPYLWITDTPPRVWTVDLDINPDPIETVVTDAAKKGSGAKLESFAGADGGVSSVRVRANGADYVDPVVTLSHPTGTGAEVEANLDGKLRYPGAVSYFEQRRWFGGSILKPSNLWATCSGTESDMSYSLPSQASDRIAVRVAAREANRIRHIVPLGQLMLLTSSAEWRVSPLNSDAITPTSMSVRPQSYVGASNVQPLVIANQMIYAADRGGHLRECGYSYTAGGYISNDLCLRSPHLFDNFTVMALTYSKAPWPIVYAVSSSGALLSFTYVPEQQVGGFSQISTDGIFEACCAISEGEEDVLYCVISRTVNGVKKRFVERMHEQQYGDIKHAVFLDCSGTYEGEPKTEIGGLTWLEGATVSILADGAVEPSQKVVDGKITLQSPASIVQVGLPYAVELQTLPLALQLQDGSFGAGHRKNVRSVSMRVLDTYGISAGPDEENLSPYLPRGQECPGSVPEAVNDEVTFDIEPDWSASGQVVVQQNVPLPFRLISMTTTLETA